MSQDVIITLLELVALALPAIGIYLQVLKSLHESTRQDSIGIDATNRMLDFNLAKFGMFVITLSGLLDVIYLVMVHIPLPDAVQTSVDPGISSMILDILLIFALLLIGFGLLLFAGSVYFSFGVSYMLNQNTMRTTISTAWIILLPCRSYDPREGDEN